MRAFTCIGCPIGCKLKVETDREGSLKVSGNCCHVGESFAINEYANPTKVLTTYVKVYGASIPIVSVKSAMPLPINSLSECVKLLNDFYAEAPVKMGDVIYRDILGTGIDIIATSDVYKNSSH